MFLLMSCQFLLYKSTRIKTNAVFIRAKILPTRLEALSSTEFTLTMKNRLYDRKEKKTAIRD